MTEGISFNPPALPLIARKRPVIEQPAIPSREDSHQNISQTPIDGTRTSPQSVQHRPLYAVPFDPKNMATTSQASHIPNSTELFNYDELRQVNSLLDGFRFRYLDLATRYAAIQQDFSAAQSKLVDAEYGWQSDRAALQRANQGCQELQVHVESLLNRINQMSGVQQSFKEKGDSIEDLVSSLEKLKSQMSIKISKLEDDLQVERDKYLTMVEKLEALKSDYEKELSDHKQKLDKTAAELVEMTSEKSWGSDELRKAQEEQNRISEELSHAKESLQAVKHQLEGQFTDFKKGTRQLIKRLASDMGCRQPSSFGDSSIVALENVIKELVDEQQAMIRSNLKDLDKTTLDAKENLEKAMQELSEKCQQLSYVESELTIIKTKSAAMELEILEKGSKIDRLEGRVAEQQIEHSAATAKLADHQNMRMLVNLLNEVFENEASKMEYEDLRSERLSHDKCHAEEASLKQQVEFSSREKEKLISEHQKHCQLMAEPEMENTKKSDKVKLIKDKTVENLIELIERDTQELKNIPSRPVLTPASRERKPRNRTSSRSHRRSPVSNQSDMDLWSVFAKRPSPK